MTSTGNEDGGVSQGRTTIATVRFSVIAIVVLHAGCREPIAQAASSDIEQWAPNLRLHVGDRWRYRVEMVIDDDSSYEARSRTRYQLDALVDVVEVGPNRIVTREELERTFGESDSGSGWRSFDGFATRNVFDAAGNLVSRSATGSDAWLITDVFLRPIVDLRHSPPAFATAGATWTRAYDVVDASGLESARVQDAFVFGGILPCGYGPKCINVRTRDHDQDTSVWSTRKRIADGQRDVVIDARGRTLYSSGVWESETTWEGVLDRHNSTRAETKTDSSRVATSIRLVEAPSPRPRGMSDSVGTIELMANPWAEIWIDGHHPSENRTQTPFRRTLPVGPHVIRLANRYMGHDETLKVIIEPARVTSIDRDWCVGDRVDGPGC